MAYSVDGATGDVVINGFEKGIGDNPYSGLTDVKSMNISSIPGEASVNFSTQSVTQAASYQNVSATAFGDGFGITLTGLDGTDFFEVGQVVTFNGGSITGLGTGTNVYIATANKVTGNSQTVSFTLTYGGVSGDYPIGTTGTTAVTTIDPTRPKFFESMNSGSTGTNFMLDASGRVWSDRHLTAGGTGITATNSWTYTNNTVAADSNGNGLVYWRTANGSSVGDWDGYLLVFRDGAIDYSNVNGVNSGVAYDHVGTYVNGWNPNTASTGASAYLTGHLISACPHNAILGPDGNVYFVDYFTTWKIQQKDLVTPVTFSPTNASTYVVTQAHNLPIQEIGTCIAPLGNDFVIGGRFNKAYVWNGVDQLTYTNAILLAESYVFNIVTVNTNAYIFCGNRGIIYVTNGSQATPWKKLPDHISGTVEPYYIWGGAAYQKDRLYFGVYVEDNSASALTGYGGVWCVDIPTGAMYLSNQLSYGTYAGYASALYAIPPIPVFPSVTPTEPAGVGLFMGWVNGSTYGIDESISSPYTNGQSYVISDLIPVGTLLQPTTPLQIEYKLSSPLLAGESVQILTNSSLNGSFTSWGTTSGSSAVILSDNFPSPIQNIQWVSVKAVLTGTSASPSYNRLTEIRIKGATKNITSYSGIQ